MKFYVNSIVVCLLSLTSMFAFAADPETLIFSFQKQKNPDELASSTKLVGEFLSKEIGKKVEVVVPTSYGTTVQGLISQKVHVAYMDSLPYLLANNEVKLQIMAVEKRNSRTEYDSLLVVAKDSPVKTLADLKGKKMAFTSQTSTSGFLFPYSRLLADKVISKPTELDAYFSGVIYAGGYDKALLAVANGQADVAAFSDYAYEGPKANLYGTEEIRSKVRILTRTSGVPTHLIAAQANLSQELRSKIQNALMKLSKDKPEVLSSVYGAAELTLPKKDNQHVEKTQMALKATGLEPKNFVK